jgi:DNA-binding GntR family transcriptional regulator
MTVPSLSSSSTSGVAPPAPLTSFDNRDLSGRVYEVLRQDIVTGQFPPGARLSLDDLAERFGVSVSPIRDALRLLAADGLVELRSRRGAFVTQPSRAVIQEVFQFRAILECAAVDWVIAAGPPAVEVLRVHVEAMPATMVGDTHADYLTYIHHDQEFHRGLVDAIGNGKVSESYAGLASFSLIARMLHRSGSHRAPETLAEHRSILTALAAGDAATARAAIAAHLDAACADLVRRSDALASAAEREQPNAADVLLVPAAAPAAGAQDRATPRKRLARPEGAS